MAYFCISLAVFMTLMLIAKLLCADIRSTIPALVSTMSGLEALGEAPAPASWDAALSSCISAWFKPWRAIDEMLSTPCLSTTTAANFSCRYYCICRFRCTGFA